ncbi:MAG TPA: type II toxin-antitoxin system HicB family antitoxin [Solirubrobacteraceae bacterium]|jgi:predicted RNase H-like HicB family nuclease|nr:type II toxin-antitoxin system HicB family antitoxin [Solirubrobacteraceae bacterium]
MIEIDKYMIHVEGGPPTNYGAYSPDVLGCIAVGDTIDECVAEMRSALAAHFELMLEDGEDIPEPTGPGIYVKYDEAA